jgi:putative DNA methylase
MAHKEKLHNRTKGSASQSRRAVQIPEVTLLESGLPIVDLYHLATREGNAKKPIYEIHKWWARRLGSVFRALLVGATTAGTADETDRQRASKLFSQFYQRRDLTGLVVLDPFMGGGTSVVETLKRGARVIGVDVDPVAWFVTKKQIEPLSETRLERALRRVGAAVEAEIRRLYRTFAPSTRRLGEIVNAFWVARLKCNHCRRLFDAHPHYRLGFDSQHRKQEVFCRKCGRIETIALGRKRWKCVACRTITVIEHGTVLQGIYSCPHCKHSEATRDQVRPGHPLRKRLFALEFTVEGDVDRKTGKVRRQLKRATRHDLQLFREAANLLKAQARRLRYPRTSIFRQRRYDLRPISHGYSHYSQLFNARQLYCLAKLYAAIDDIKDSQAREYLLLAFSDSLAANNQLVGYAFGYHKTTPLFGIHGYHVVQRPVEGNVWGNPHFGRGSFTRCLDKLIVGKRYASTPFEYAYTPQGHPIRVYTGETVETSVVRTVPGWLSGPARALLLNRSSVNLRPIRTRSVDLILTDPPFYDNLPYSELSDFYFQWLRPVLEKYGAGKRNMVAIRESLFARRKSTSEHARYVTGLTEVMHECFRVLRKSGLLAFTFHHRQPAAWHALASAIACAGFTVTGVCPVRAEGVSGFHSYQGTPKWDSVISCRPRRPASESIGIDIERMTAKVRRIERRWFKRLQKGAIRLTSADRASLASALALREGVNSRLSNTEHADLFGRVYDLYRQKGVPRAIPGIPRRAASA